MRGAREPYHYEREVEEFLRWSPHVRRAGARGGGLSRHQLAELQRLLAGYGDSAGIGDEGRSDGLRLAEAEEHAREAEEHAREAEERARAAEARAREAAERAARAEERAEQTAEALRAAQAGDQRR